MKSKEIFKEECFKRWKHFIWKALKHNIYCTVIFFFSPWKENYTIIIWCYCNHTSVDGKDEYGQVQLGWGGVTTVCCGTRGQQLRNFSDGEEAGEIQREKSEPQGRRKCRELWEDVCREKIRARRKRSEGAEEQLRLQTWDSIKLKNKTVSVGKWEDGFVLEDVSQVTGFASHRKCVLAYICKISVALGQSILLVADLFVGIQ